MIRGGSYMKVAPILFLVAALAVSLVGCETVKGASEGLKKDWESAEGLDAWMQENMW